MLAVPQSNFTPVAAILASILSTITAKFSTCSFKSEGIKTVAVFLSGRPLWVNSHINSSDAFVAAWLPGSEGGGVADVLFGKADFKGKLPFSWPKLATQYVLNVGDKNYDPLFAHGYGLSYARLGKVCALSEISGLAPGADLPVGTWFERGKTASGLGLYLTSETALTKVETGAVETGNSWLKSSAVDRNRQEDSRRFVWSGAGEASIAIAGNGPLDLGRETNGAVAVEIDYRVDAVGAGPVKLVTCNQGLKPAGAGLDITAQIKSAEGKGWQTLSVPLSCFAKAGLDMTKVQVPISIKTSVNLDLTISRIALGTSNLGMVACP
jgi:beta-glucosidase